MVATRRGVPARAALAAAVLLALAPAARPESPRKEKSPPPARDDGKGERAPADLLKLPADIEVEPGKKLVVVRADLGGKEGEVRWIVMGETEVSEYPDHVVVGAPSPGQAVEVWAVGLVDGKLTNAARCVIAVKGARPQPQAGQGPRNGNGNGPGNGEAPPAPRAAGKLWITVVADRARLTPAQVALVYGREFKAAAKAAGDEFREYRPGDGVLRTQRLLAHVQAAGGPPVVIVQDARGNVLARERLPADGAGLVALVRRLKGGR